MKEKGKGRDKDEVRLENPVPSMLRRYGVKIRGNRLQPFCHSSNQYSGVVNERTCHCHVCGKTFDCFEIVGFFEGIDGLYDQVRFLGGEELDLEDPKRKALRERAEKLKREAEAKAKAEKDLFDSLNEKTKEMHMLREILHKEKPESGAWPSEVWSVAYNKLQSLDCQVACLLGDEETGGDIASMVDFLA